MIISRIELNININSTTLLYPQNACKHNATLQHLHLFYNKTVLSATIIQLSLVISVQLAQNSHPDIINNLPMSIKKKPFLPKYIYK